MTTTKISLSKQVTARKARSQRSLSLEIRQNLRRKNESKIAFNNFTFQIRNSEFGIRCINSIFCVFRSKTKTDKAEKGEKNDKTKTERIDLSVADDVLSSIPLVPPAPCSIMCNGKKGMLPNLLCGRCLCLFHPECVPSGIYLDDPHRFICPVSSCILIFVISPDLVIFLELHQSIRLG